MKSIRHGFLPVLAALVLSGSASFAQVPGGGVKVALLKLFGEATNFTATADVFVFDAAQKEQMRMPMNFSLLQDKVRVDIDLGQVKSAEMPPSAIAGLKKVGLDRVASVIRLDKKATYIIYPIAKSYVNMPMSKEDVDASGQNLKIEKTPFGNETITGRPCVKNRVVVRDDKGAVVMEALTWNAADLKDFPVQIQMREDNHTTIMRFSQIKLVAPDAKQFEIPAGFTAYSDPQSLMWAAGQKQGATPKR